MKGCYVINTGHSPGTHWMALSTTSSSEMELFNIMAMLVKQYGKDLLHKRQTVNYIALYYNMKAVSCVLCLKCLLLSEM